MSSIIARMFFGATIAIVAAVVYAYSNRRSENSSHQSRRGENTSSSQYEPRNRWECEDDEEEDIPRVSRRTSSARVVDDETSSISSRSSVDIVKKCGICLELFSHLKERGIAIHSTSCGHLFCINCIRQCPQCPNCRKVIRPNSTLRVFL